MTAGREETERVNRLRKDGRYLTRFNAIATHYTLEVILAAYAGKRPQRKDLETQLAIRWREKWIRKKIFLVVDGS